MIVSFSILSSLGCGVSLILSCSGLIGFPSVGKSTFLSVVSRARPEIADYPFTTIEPNIGVVTLPDERSFVLADMPGLIEGAGEGNGFNPFSDEQDGQKTPNILEYGENGDQIMKDILDYI